MLQFNRMTKQNDLSEREIEILSLVAKGKSNKDISQELFISPNTVKVHLRNIFSKIGVTTRTEATLFAIREGMVKVNGMSTSDNIEAVKADPVMVDEPLTSDLSQEGISLNLLVPIYRRYAVLLVAGVVLILIGVVYFAFRNGFPTLANNPNITPITPSEPLRWEPLQAMPTPRGALALELFDNQIYTIGGENASGVLAVTERFDPKTGAWLHLSPKPTAVTDIGAVVIGGKIYVPGGRVASGQATDVLEIYDPRQNVWEQGKPLPAPTSAYAVVAFEGRMYVFGGWDGTKYVDTVYKYDPSRNEWETSTPIPTPRGFARAAIAGGIIYILGGFDGQKALDNNEAYNPVLELGSDNPWSTASPLVTPRYAMGVTSIADHIHIIGGEGNIGVENSHLEFIPARNEWRLRATIVPLPWAYLGLIAFDTHLYAIGGLVEGVPSAQNASFQALFTVLLPTVK